MAPAATDLRVRVATAADAAAIAGLRALWSAGGAAGPRFARDVAEWLDEEGESEPCRSTSAPASSSPARRPPATACSSAQDPEPLAVRASELLVVWPHRSFRRAPGLDRPELRAAYAIGAEHRLAGGRVPQEALDALDLADSGVRHAYMAAFVEIKGPPSLVLGVLPSLGYALTAPPGPRRRGVREVAPAFLGMLALTWICERADARLRRRRALALGLTRETAPIAALAPSAIVHQLLSLIVETIAARRGRRARRTATDALAAQIVRSVMIRRSWQRAASVVSRKFVRGPAPPTAHEFLNQDTRRSG